jgi:hypothetical protein
MIRLRCLCACLAIIWFARTAAAQESLPTDVELHSAYCIPVLRWQIQFSRQVVDQADAGEKSAQTPELRQQAATVKGNLLKFVADLESSLNRLQLYLFPRMQHRDPFALLAASKRAEADLKEFQQRTDRCPSECGLDGVPKNEQQQACFETCTDKDLTSRIRACATPTWLPF